MLKYSENRLKQDSKRFQDNFTVTLKSSGFLWRFIYDIMTSLIICYPGLDTSFFIESLGISSKYSIGMLVEVL